MNEPAAEHLFQTVFRDESCQRVVIGPELIAQRFVRAAGPQIDIHHQPWIIDAVIVSPGPAVVGVPLVDMRDIEFAVGGKAGGESKGTIAPVLKVVRKDIARAALQY